MILYLDTSSLIKLYLEEEGSAAVRAQVDHASVIATSVVAHAFFSQWPAVEGGLSLYPPIRRSEGHTGGRHC